MSAQPPPAICRLLQRVPPPIELLAADPCVVATLPSSRLRAMIDAPQNTADWQNDVAMLHLRMGNGTASLEHSRLAGRLSARAASPLGLRDARATQTLACVALGRFDAAEELLEMVRGLESDGDPAISIYDELAGWHALRTGTFFSGHYPRSLEHFEAAVAHYRAVGREDYVIGGLDGLANAHSAQSHYVNALETIDEALAIAIRNSDWTYVHRLLVDRATCLSDIGYHDLAEEAFDLAVEWCEFVEDHLTLSVALREYADLVGRRTRHGRQDGVERARALSTRAIAEAEFGGCVPSVVQARQTIARILGETGHRHEADEHHRLAHDAIESAVPQGISKILEMREREKKAVEEGRMLRLAERMQATAESSPDAVMVFEPTVQTHGRANDYSNEFRNSSAERLLQCGPTDFLMLSGLAKRPFMRDMESIVRWVIGERSAYEDEIHANHRWFVRRVVPCGQGAAVCIRDVTEAHEAQDRLRDAVRKAQVADRAKSEFLANMSHEVRTPINGVLGLAGLLADTKLTGLQRSYVDGIIAGTDLLLGVVGDVLDLARIEAGRLQLDPEDVHIRTLVRDLRSVFLGQAKQRGLTLEAHVDESVPETIHADLTRLRQVLANLLGNAVKFTHEGKIELNAEAVDGHLVFTVRDTGIGIGLEKLSAIFRAFEQAHSVPESRGGSGLGLAITRRLVTVMGGDVSVESEVGVGSVFRIQLPLVTVEEHKKRASQSPSAEPVDYKGHRVLLAEDNSTNALVARSLLERMGVEVEVAKDGLAAVAAAVRGGFSLILMDVRMPTLDGLEATRRIRQLEARSGHRTAIIAVTAGALSEEREECFAAGMDDFLGKPFRKDALKRVLDRWIGKPRSIV